MTTKNLLIELFVEELPPKALKALGESFARTIAESLKASGLASAQSAVTPFASPRRLGAHVSGVLDQADDKPVTTLPSCRSSSANRTARPRRCSSTPS
jgi:glycyl-tRNA synthetase beta chain